MGGTKHYYLVIILVMILAKAVAQDEPIESDDDDDEATTEEDDEHVEEKSGEEEFNCDKFVYDGEPWDEETWDKILSWKEIPACYYSTHTHPRQQPRPKDLRSEDEEEQFHHLALFIIRNDLDFQEAGDRCSVKLHEEWLLGDDGPVHLDEYSYNRIWYERMCNPFSFLECIPWEEARVKSKRVVDGTSIHKVSIHDKHSHPGALVDQHPHLPPDTNYTTKNKLRKAELPLQYQKLIPPTSKPRDSDNILLNYSTPYRDTSRLHRWYIGGRGPGKGRHKSGPGVQRVDPTKVLGTPMALPVETPGYELNGVCACSTFDPKYPDRKRPKFGMDFVEDELRPDWCVSAPGGLCGRIYFPRKVWPGQDFDMSDHIGCPRKYKGVEYECVRWSLLTNRENQPSDKWKKPYSFTATCEVKQEIVEGAGGLKGSGLITLIVIIITLILN